MNKELKVLKEIRECLYGDVYAGVERKLDIIESALKREDSIETTAIDIEQENQALCKENKKLKRALEIIKKKRVCVLLLDGCDNVEQYNNSIDLFEIPKKNRNKYHLTQEEYNLLKEVLL